MCREHPSGFGLHPSHLPPFHFFPENLGSDKLPQLYTTNVRLLLQFALQCDILLSNRFESASSTVQQGGTGGLNAVLRFEETQIS